MSEELAYSIHLGSDKNKTTKAKKVANAVIHFDELSPHLVGVPIKDGYIKGMKKQPAKSKVFTKE